LLVAPAAIIICDLRVEGSALDFLVTAGNKHYGNLIGIPDDAVQRWLDAIKVRPPRILLSLKKSNRARGNLLPSFMRPHLQGEAPCIQPLVKGPKTQRIATPYLPVEPGQDQTADYLEHGLATPLHGTGSVHNKQVAVALWLHTIGLCAEGERSQPHQKRQPHHSQPNQPTPGTATVTGFSNSFINLVLFSHATLSGTASYLGR